MSSCFRRTLPALAVALAAGAFPAAAPAAITEFGGLTAGTPAGITAGPDGALWFTEQGIPGAIGRITTDGTVTEYVAGVAPGFTAGSDPADIATGPDGALWFTEPGVVEVDGVITEEDGVAAAIGRLDPATGTVTEYTAGLSPGSQPTGIALGPDGNLWFTERAKGAIGRITPAGAITEFTSGLSGSSAPTDIAAGADGAMWFTEKADPGRIGRIDPATAVITEFSEGLTPNGGPNGIVSASSGKLYFTQTAGSRVGRIKTDGTIEEYSSGLTAGSKPGGIAEGGDGALWLTEAASPGRIGRLWPSSGAITELTGGVASLFSVDSAPAGIAQGPDGNVWFTQGAGRIARVTVPPLADIGTPSAAPDGKVRLQARVRPNSQATTYFLEYGPTTEYGTQTAVAAAGAGADPVEVSSDVELARDAHYHVRVTAVNASGTAVSDDLAFYVGLDGGILNEKPADKVDGTSTVVTEQPATAPAAPATTDPVPGAVPAVAAPVLGRTVSVVPVTGSVRVKRPGEKRYTPLTAGASVRVGSLVDTRRGTVELRSARNAAGRTQKGRFWGAIFQVRQRRDTRGMTDLVLRGGRFSRCPSARASIAALPRDAKRRRVVRRLWGRDRHARFRTHGRDSVATVRGTVWATIDRCDGTRTKVKQGKVLVRDLRRKRSVLVTAGRSYLARHRR